MQHSFSEQLHEQMSAFIDGELPAAEIELLLRRLEREPELRATLARYAAMGESLRGEPDCLSRGFTSRVAAAISAEAQSHAEDIPLTSAPLRGRARGAGRLGWLRTAGSWVAGVGIAATVAGLAIFTLQRQQGIDATTQIAAVTPPTAQTVVIGEGGPVKSNEALSYTVPALATSRPLMDGAHLTDYVLAHSEYSSPLGRRNVLSGIIAEDPTPIDAAGAATIEGQTRQLIQPERLP